MSISAEQGYLLAMTKLGVAAVALLGRSPSLQRIVAKDGAFEARPFVSVYTVVRYQLAP